MPEGKTFKLGDDVTLAYVVVGEPPVGKVVKIAVALDSGYTSYTVKWENNPNEISYSNYALQLLTIPVPDELKVGDRVRTNDCAEGEIIEVSHATVRVKWDDGSSHTWCMKEYIVKASRTAPIEAKEMKPYKKPEEKPRSFVHGSSTKCPRYDLIPRHPLTRLAARCEEGLVNHGDKAWNARNNPAALTEKEWIIERLNHVVNHTLELIHQLTHDLPVDGDDNASAIMWGGMLACEVTKDGNPFIAPGAIDNNLGGIYSIGVDKAAPDSDKTVTQHFDAEWGGDNEIIKTSSVPEQKPRFESYFVGDYVRWSEHPKEGPWYYGVVAKQSLGNMALLLVKDKLSNNTKYISKKSKITIEKINKETYDVGGSYEEVETNVKQDNTACPTNRCAYRLGHIGECGDSYGNRL